MEKLLGIQYLRALAAVAVVCFHAASKEDAHFLIGEAGVDVFFVISGFLMVAITSPSTKPLTFLADRLKRVVPVYWIATSVMLLGAMSGIFPNAELDPWHVIASYLFLPAISPVTDNIWPLLVPGWTLNYEVAFYSLFALTLCFSSERNRVFLLISLILAAVFIGTIISPVGAVGRFYSNQIILEFAAGALLGLIWKQYRHKFSNGPLLMGSGLLGFAIAAYLNSDANRALIFGLPALLIVAGTLAFERNFVIRKWFLPLLLGNASYSIYIWHTLSISLTSKFASIIGLPSIAAVIFNIFGGIIMGLLAFIFLEEPIRKSLKSKSGTAIFFTAA